MYGQQRLQPQGGLKTDGLSAEREMEAGIGIEPIFTDLQSAA